MMAKKFKPWFYFGVVLSTLLALTSPYWAWDQWSYKTLRTVISYNNMTFIQKMGKQISFSQMKKFLQEYTFTPDPAQNALAPGLAPKTDGMLFKVGSLLPIRLSSQPLLNIFLLEDGREVRQRQRVLSPFQDSSLLDSSSLEGLFVMGANSIYLSSRDLRTGILAHEMTHYLLCQFVPVPPAPFQEKWAQYVETQVD